jgi:ubiquinone/menaquinone biosynthesis C-methylase UbiE
MSATPTPDIPVLKKKLHDTWVSGDYDHFSRYMETGARTFFDSLSIPRGAKVLDVACGSGQLALIAARSGSKATGVDIAENLIERGNHRAKAEGLDATFEVGDAEELPFADESFDYVVSCVGAMFAPRPELVSKELVRVCKPGGRIAMVNWTPAGFIGQMLKTVSGFIAPAGFPSPLLWGDEAKVRERLGGLVSKLETEEREYLFSYPFAPHDVVEFFRRCYGPTHRAFEMLDTEQQAKLQGELEALWAGANLATPEITVVKAEYLAVLATR